MVPEKKEVRTRTPKIPITLMKWQRSLKLSRSRKQVRKSKSEKMDRRLVFCRGQAYAAEYLKREKEEIRMKKAAKRSKSLFVPEENKLAFVIRIKGIPQMPPKAKKTLRLLRLIKINSGVFVKLNKATINMLKLVDPYIAWGYPNLKSVRELIYKRGHVKINNQKISITDNTVIRDSLLNCGIICMEDLIHEIFTVGRNFKKANNFLWPFNLSCPKGGFIKKRKHFIEGGDFGNREEYINKLIRSMN